MGRLPRIFAVFVAGALVGTTADFFHFVTRTDGYPEGWPRLPLFGTPIWVPPLFGLAAVLIALGHLLGDGWMRRAPRPLPPSRGKALGGLAFFVILYACSGFLPSSLRWAKDLLLFLFAAGIWWAYDRTPVGVAQALITALGGVLAEMALIHAGAFFYFPDSAGFLGLPSWLPWLYASASVTVGNFARAYLRQAPDGKSAPR